MIIKILSSPLPRILLAVWMKSRMTSGTDFDTLGRVSDGQSGTCRHISVTSRADIKSAVDFIYVSDSEE